jgi:hypothetical protein
LKNNKSYPDLIASLVDIASILIEKNPEYELHMIKEDILEPIK